MGSAEHQESAAPARLRSARAELVRRMVRPAAVIDACGVNDAQEIQWRKIDLMWQVANRVWGRV